MPANLPEPAGSQDQANLRTDRDHTPDSAAPEPTVVEPARAAEPAASEPAAVPPGAPESRDADPPPPSAAADSAVDPAGKARVRRLIVIGVAAVLLVAAAVLLGFINHAARANGPLANEAFVDTGATSAVVGDMTSAIKVVYSYDYNSLDANQSAAKAVITGRFAQDFDKVFAGVRQFAPQQQAVLTTTVPAVGVVQLRGDRARVLMMVDQNGTRMGSQPIAGTSARLIVEAQQVDGHWKISEVTPE